jgi:predicted methyltransferase
MHRSSNIKEEERYMSRSQKLSSLLVAATLAFLPTVSADCIADGLTKAATGKHRAEKNVKRNNSRNPVETLKFFGISPTMTVVEISPGGGAWYTEILAPFLRDSGKLYLGSYDTSVDSDYVRRNSKRLDEKLAAHPDVYDKAVLGVFNPGTSMEAAPANSADMVLTFRNTHNWARSGKAEQAYAGMYSLVKPGGILGVVQHRGKDGEDYTGKEGYLTEAQVVAIAEGAGFVLLDKSEVNANPKDTKDHPNGVWSLPPVLRLSDEDKGMEPAMKAMGESDRMTLKFIKPVKMPEIK